MSRLVLVCGFFSILTFSRVVIAQTPDRDVARAWFEQGVGHASRHEWPQAVDALERSRALDERVPTLFNLMLAYDALERPLDVARTVRSFLMRADPARHQAERTRALELEAKAYAALARVRVQGAPPDAQLTVDSAPPVLSADARTILLTPGHHELAASAAGFESGTVTLDVVAGESRVLDMTLTKSVVDEAQPAAKPDVITALPTPALHPLPVASESNPPLQFAPWRKPVARAFAMVGAATWLGSAAVLATAYGRASDLKRTDSTQPGYLTASDDYQRITRAIIPLSLVSAAVLSTATVTWPRQRR